MDQAFYHQYFFPYGLLPNGFKEHSRYSEVYKIKQLNF